MNIKNTPERARGGSHPARAIALRLRERAQSSHRCIMLRSGLEARAENGGRR